MLFHSIEFLIFLPIVFALYWKVGNNYRLQNLVVVLASCVFYGWWDWRFLFLIFFSTTCSYAGGLLLARFRGQAFCQKLVCGINIGVILSLLFFFKYFNFFQESLSDVMRLLGFHPDFCTLHILLPVGISFYTFQLISYTIDVYRNKIQPTRDYIQFFAFISFFPQLVAGPIERATHILPQFQKARTFCYAQATDGLRQMLWGFCKKVILADNCALAVNMIFADYTHLNGVDLLVGALLFSFQIYGDFSGYSDIAIGCAHLFGVDLMRNFKTPYFTRNIAEFWRCWHISLTTWFKDYLYIPLGGSRCAPRKIIRNIFIVFLVSGLWHGANWTYIVWGLYHACLFLPLYLAGQNRTHLDTIAAGRLWPRWNECLQMTTTFLLVMIGWVIFRAETLEQAVHYLYLMGSRFHPALPVHGKTALLLVVVFLLVEWLQRTKKHPLELEEVCIFRYRICRYVLYYLLIWGILNFSTEQTQFIYFNF